MNMDIKRVSFGFDLRVNPDSLKENPSQVNQYLVSGLRSPISADANVWVATEEIESLTRQMLPDFANPLHLKKSVDLLVDACLKRGISTSGLWPVCFTGLESNLIALRERFGPRIFRQTAKRGGSFISRMAASRIRHRGLRRVDQWIEGLRVR